MAENIGIGLSIEFPFKIAEKNLTATLNQLQQNTKGLKIDLFNNGAIKNFNQSIKTTQQSFQKITQDSKLSSDAFKVLQTKVQSINKSASEYAKVTVNTYKNTKNIKSATIEYTDNMGRAVKQTMAWEQQLDKIDGKTKNVFQTTGFTFVDDFKKANAEIIKSNKLAEQQLQYKQKVKLALDKNIKKEREKTENLGVQLELYKEQSARQVSSLKNSGLKNVYNPKDLLDYENAVNKLRVSDGNLSQQMKILDSQFKNIKTSAQNSSKALKVTNDKAQSLGTTIQKSGKKFMLWMGITGVFFAATRSINDMISQVKVLDNAQVSLLKVTNLTDAGINKLTESSFVLGNTLGKTTSEVLTAITSFSKMGYDANIEASKLAESALMLTNIGDEISLEDSTSTIISALKGFELSVDSAEKIIDSYNNVSNNFAVTTQDLATAVQTVSATMNQAGNSFDQTLSLFTSANEIINSASRSSTGLRTIALRIRGVTEDGTELEGLVPSLEAKFNKFGLSLKKDDQTFKSTYDILRDLSTVYKQMSDFDFADISEDIAGKRRSDILNAILQNFSTAEASLQASINSFGSAAEENERFLSSISGATAKWNSQLQKLYTSTINKDWVKNIVNLGTSILKIVDHIGLLSISFTGLITYLGIFNTTVKTKLISSIGTSIASFRGLSGVASASAISIKGLTISVSTLASTLTLGLAVAIPLIIKGISKLNNATKERLIFLQDENLAIKEQINTTQNSINSMSDLINEYNDLTKEEFLNNQEQQRLNELRKKLRTDYPELLKYIDSEGKLWANVNTVLDEGNLILSERLANEKEDLFNNSLETAKTGIKNLNNTLGKEIDSIESKMTRLEHSLYGNSSSVFSDTETDKMSQNLSKTKNKLVEKQSEYKVETSKLLNDVVVNYLDFQERIGAINQNVGNDVISLQDSFISLFSKTLSDSIVVSESMIDNEEAIDKFKDSLKDFTIALSDVEFQKVVKGYEDLSEEVRKGIKTNVDATNYYNNSLIPAFGNVIEKTLGMKVGYEELKLITTDVFGALPDDIEVIANQTTQATDSLSTYITEADKLDTSVDSTTDSLSTLGSAFQTLSKNEELSSETMLDLIRDYPLLAKHMTETGDVTFNNGELIKTLFEIKKQTYVKELEIEAQKTKAVIDGITARINQRNAEMRGMMSYAEMVGRTNKMMAEAGLDVESMRRYDSLIAQIQVLKNVELGDFGSKKSSSGESSSSSSKQTNALADYFDQLNKIDKMKADISMLESKERALGIDNTKEQIKLNEQLQDELHTLNNLRKVDKLLIEEQLAKIRKGSKEEIELKEKLADLNKDIASTANDWWTIENKIKKEIEEQNKERNKQVEEAIKAVGKDELQQLQDKIDLLKEVKKDELDEIESVYKKKKESLEDSRDYELDNMELIHNKKIDALDDLKKADDQYYSEQIRNLERTHEAQEKVNDEVKRAQELIKAQERLENIKKERNVRMLKGDKFEWVADPRELKKAQEDIDKLLKTDAEIKRKNEYDTEKQHLEDLKRLRLQDLSDQKEVENRDYEEQKRRRTQYWNDELEGEKNHYENLKETTTKYYDNRIENLEGFNEEWSKVISGEVQQLEDYKTVFASLTDKEKEVYAERLAELRNFVSERNKILAENQVTSTTNNGASSYTSSSSTVIGGSSGSISGSASRTTRADDYADEMTRNSKKWHTASSEEQKRLAARNKDLAKKIGKTTGSPPKFDSHTGKWNNLEYHHKGIDSGFVGGNAFNPKHETVAKLLKGELVLNKFNLDNLVPNIFKGLTSNFKMPNFTPMQPAIAGNNGMTFTGDIQVVANNPEQFSNEMRRWKQVNIR